LGSFIGAKCPPSATLVSDTAPPAPIAEAFAEDESDEITPVARERTAIGKGDVPGGIVTLFDDNSIELETASGRQ
jgi:hypothetical protein